MLKIIIDNCKRSHLYSNKYKCILCYIVVYYAIFTVWYTVVNSVFIFVNIK